MTSRHSRFISRPLLPRCVTFWTLVSVGMLASATIAWGQGEDSHAMVTEIWMSGEDLAVTRRIPQDRRSAQHSYDEVARSMVNIAESQYQDRDEMTAEWLHQWARELTDGRIGNNPRIANRHQRFLEFAVPTITQPEPLENERFLPPTLNFDPTGLEIEWPISAFNDKSTPDDAQHIDYESEPRRNSQPQDDGRERILEQQTNGGPSANDLEGREKTRTEAYAGAGSATGLNPSTQPFPLPELVANQRENPMDNASRQVASVPVNMNQGFANHLHHAAPAAPPERSTLLALSCFAAGVVCCFVLHTLLLLTPVRLTVCRPSMSPSRTPDDSSVQATRTGEAGETARRVSLSSRPHTPTRDISAERDKASSMVEEFYNSNIELFERFAQSNN